jgi:hypothetical protein
MQSSAILKTLDPISPSSTTADCERSLEFEFVRATENAALNVMHWLGRGEKEPADAAACDAINGAFDLVDIRGEVVIGEGIKDNAPGIFLGDRLGNWKEDAPLFDIALDPIDGTIQKCVSEFSIPGRLLQRNAGVKTPAPPPMASTLRFPPKQQRRHRGIFLMSRKPVGQRLWTRNAILCHSNAPKLDRSTSLPIIRQTR